MRKKEKKNNKNRKNDEEDGEGGEEEIISYLKEEKEKTLLFKLIVTSYEFSINVWKKHII